MSEKTSFFRCFSLYNIKGNYDNLPRSGEQGTGDEKSYNTLGYFDEFRTKTVTVKQKNGNMPELWESINKMNSALIDDSVEDYSAKSYQNIFGYPFSYNRINGADEYGGAFVSDEEFWESNEYPYIFTILVQFFDHNENENQEDVLKDKIDTYIKKYLEHIGINFRDYHKVFSLKPKKEGEEEGDPFPLDFYPDEEDQKFILTDYVTFDRYDYILCVKSRCYLPFVLATQQLHSLVFMKEAKSFSSVGSFTVTAINHMYQGRIANETVPSICIKCNYAEDHIYFYNKKHIKDIMEDDTKKFNVLNYMHSYQEKLKDSLYSEEEKREIETLKFDNYFMMYYISGENDIRIIARYVRMKKIISLFISDESPLKDRFLGDFSTSINVINNDCNEFLPEETPGLSNTELCKKIVECKNMISELGQKGYPNESIKIMHQINSGLSAIMPKNPYYRGYGFLSLFPDFFAFIKRLHHEIVEKEQPIDSKRDIDQIQDLIQFIGAALLTTIRSDFKEFQIPTFNANLYYSPTKLLVFYRAFIMCFMEYYAPFYEKTEEGYGKKSAQKSEQHFIIAPGNRFGATVFEKAGGVYEDGSVSERYFTCEISEKNIYYLKNTMIILSHEISHYGLKTIRNRKDRYRRIINTYIIAFIDFMFRSIASGLVSCIDNLSDDSWNDSSSDSKKKALWDLCGKIFTGGLKNTLFEITENIYIVRDKINDIEEKNKYHFRKMIPIIESNFREIYSEVKNEVFRLIYLEVQEKLLSLQLIKISARIELNGRVKEIIEKSVETNYQMVFFNRDNMDIHSVYEFVFYHYEEIFSDLLCILTLDLSPEDYYNTLKEKQEFKVDGQGYISSSSQDYRFCLVADSLYQSLDVLKERKKNSEYYREIAEYAQTLFHYDKWENDKFSSDIMNAYQSIEKRSFDVFASSWNDEKSHRQYNEINLHKEYPVRILFYDKRIHQNITDYMTECVIAYFEQMKTAQINDKPVSPRKIYEEINDSENDYEKKIFCIDNFLSQFEIKQMDSLNPKPKEQE